MSRETLIDMQQVSKRFGMRTALDRVDFQVVQGEIVGLAGANGSGKTTLLKLAAGLLAPSSGAVTLFGLEPFRTRGRVMREARFAFAPPPLYERLTGREHLECIAPLGRSRDLRPTGSEFERALALVDLADRGDDPVRSYSFGMRQRLALALALVPRPRLLVLDEPADGLDPRAVASLRRLLLRLRDEFEVTIVLAGHQLREIEALADRLLVLDEGRTVFYGRPEELLRTTRGVRLRVRDAERAAEVLRAAQRDVVVIGPRELELPVRSITLEEARECLLAAGLTLEAYHERSGSLEEALFEHGAGEDPHCERGDRAS